MKKTLFFFSTKCWSRNHSFVHSFVLGLIYFRFHRKWNKNFHRRAVADLVHSPGGRCVGTSRRGRGRGRLPLNPLGPFLVCYLPMPASQHIPTYVCLQTSTYLRLPPNIYLPMSASQHLPTYDCLPTSTYLYQLTYTYLPTYVYLSLYISI